MAGTDELMWRRLLGWARAVKARQGAAGRRANALPPLWLFSDARRHPDLPGLVGRLPRGLCGVVLRHDRHPERAAIAARLARVCRERRCTLVIAEPRLAYAYRSGLHLRRGRPALPGLGPPLLTSSAHGQAELVRAGRAGAGLVFLSPCFATAGHPGAVALGPTRWAALAGRTVPGRPTVAALGGIDACRVRSLPRRCVAAAAIGAFDWLARQPLAPVAAVSSGLL